MTYVEMKAGAIEHWKRVRRDPIGCYLCGEVINPGSCSFCNVYCRRDCDGCPIADAVGQTLCNGTPYPKAHDAWVRLHLFLFHRGTTRHTDHAANWNHNPVEFLNRIGEWRRAAAAELRFLRDLEV